MSKDDEYMHEINKLEGERDYWRRMHAKTDAELVTMRNALDEARRAARQLYDLWPVEFWATLNGIVESFPWIESVGGADSVSVPSA